MSQPSVNDDRGGAPACAGLIALLRNVIDYAGLFPPAALDMAATVANYAAYVASDDAWMLERLVVPAARLEEMERHAGSLLPRTPEADPWPISALVRPDHLEEDLRGIHAFNDRHAKPERGLAVVDVVELPAATPAAIDDALDRIPPDLFPFIEIPVRDDPRGLIATLVGGDAGAKIRTGGPSADLYPGTSEVARFLAACAAADVPFKATAGLHHPLRHHAATVGATELGFLNVFVAAALALWRDLAEGDLCRVLEAESIDAFEFDGQGIGCHGHRLSAEEVEDARLTFAVSFGSCSFDEPRDDLRALGLLT